MHSYLAGILYNLECKDVLVGGVADHIHVDCRLTKKHASMHVLEVIKRDSSKWVKIEFPHLNRFHWQDGYGLFSISPSHVNAVRTYIENQERHHKTESFQSEYRRILTKYDIELNEKYLWD